MQLKRNLTFQCIRDTATRLGPSHENQISPLSSNQAKNLFRLQMKCVITTKNNGESVDPAQQRGKMAISPASCGISNNASLSDHFNLPTDAYANLSLADITPSNKSQLCISQPTGATTEPSIYCNVYFVKILIKKMWHNFPGIY